MFRNYLKIAFRNLVKHKLYSVINIGGLSIGIGACLLILLFVLHEHSYDNFHQGADRIYSVYAKIKIGGDSVQFPKMSYATGPAVQKADPSVLHSLRLEEIYEKKSVANLASPEKKFAEKGFIFSDSNFFSFFSFHLKTGNPDQALAKPFTVVITEEMARKYFGNADPIGKLLQYDSAYRFEITGVVEKAPSNSSIGYDFIASLSSLPAMKGGKSLGENPDVLYGNFTTFFLLNKGARPENIEHTLQRLAKQNKIMRDVPARYMLSALKNSHLQLNFTEDSNSKYLAIFPLVAGLILLLALINYMNLATARAVLRAREVGIRKASGASRIRIAQQFYTESALYAIVAFAGGFFLFRLLQPAFYRLINVPIDPSFVYQPLVLGSFAGLLLITIFIAGTYPSLVLSAYKPVATLYGKMSRQQGGSRLRKSLTVFQFSISIVLIICSLLISRQLYFFRHTDTGVNRENVINIPFTHTMDHHYQAFRKEVESLPGIRDVALARYAFYEGFDMWQANSQGPGKDVSTTVLTADNRYIPLLKLQWKIPPGNRSVYLQDHQVIINEAAIGKLQLSPDPVGKQLSLGGNEKYTVAGVLKDFNYSSLHNKVESLCLLISKDSITGQGTNSIGCLIVRIDPGANIPTTIASLKKIYDRYDLNTPFEFDFMDDIFNAQYKAEDKLAAMLDIFTGLTVLIACLGLFGLAAFSATQKTKEIGIRKVLGASVRSLVLLMSKDFIRLVLISIIVSVPIAWYTMHKWLEGFAYRIPIGWSVFVLAGAGAIGIALLTVSWEALRTAMANPVESLKAD